MKSKRAFTSARPVETMEQAFRRAWGTKRRPGFLRGLLWLDFKLGRHRRQRRFLTRAERAELFP